MSSFYIDKAKLNKANLVTLTPSAGGSGAIPISAFIESDVSIGMGAEWSPLFGSVESKVGVAETTGNLVSNLTGGGAFSLRNQTLSQVRWKSTQPLRIPLSLTLVATSKETYAGDIRAPLDSLLAGIFPSNDTQKGSLVFKPPMNYGTGSNGRWAIKIGSSFRSTSYFILKELSPVLSRYQTGEGALYVKIQVVFETYQTPTFKEVREWFSPSSEPRVTTRN